MFVPEYTISNEILKNISDVEYAKAIIENTKILPSWEKQLVKDAQMRNIQYLLELEGTAVSPSKVKKFIDGIDTKPTTEIKNFKNALNHTKDERNLRELTEKAIKKFHITLSQGVVPNLKQGVYRNQKIAGCIDPEEILAEMVEFLDWHESRDAKDSHPIITAGIIRGHFEVLHPFDFANTAVASMLSLISLESRGYEMKNFICLEEFYIQNTLRYEKAVESITEDEGDMTYWLEYFTRGFVYEASKIKEKVMMLAKDTKVAKVSGRIRLSPRQERIVEYLQDYGILQNQDFGKLFPAKSEDTVLRDLKILLDKGLIVKRGKTKSSRYELK